VRRKLVDASFLGEFAHNMPDNLFSDGSDACLSSRGVHTLLPDTGHWLLFDDSAAVADASG
jgi:hypothetical protein